MNKLIVAIDDSEEDLRPSVPDDFELEVIDPGDEQLPTLLADAIGKASLILLDQKFNPEPQPLSLTAADGASFVSHLRAWSRQHASGLAPVVLFTNDSEAFENEIPAVGASVALKGSFVGREFQIAPALDVEWVQYKAEDGVKERISGLANASIQAEEKIGNDGASLADLELFLCLPEDAVWSESAQEGLRNSRPPISQKADGTSKSCGPSQVIRWMCHRALPFPGLFFSDLYAAWALGLDVDTFREMTYLNVETEWLQDLQEAEYCGPLNEFLGRRWWRAGIDYLVWKLDQEAVAQNDRLQALKKLALGLEVNNLTSSSTHVVVWSPDLLEEDVASIEEAAQLHPPGWPAEALDPWILKDDLENDEILRAMIEQSDLP